IQRLIEEEGGGAHASLARGIHPRVQRDLLPTLTAQHQEPRPLLLRERGRVRYPLRRSEEHTSELQSRVDLVCRLLLENKKQKRLAAAVLWRSASLDSIAYSTEADRAVTMIEGG